MGRTQSVETQLRHAKEEARMYKQSTQDLMSKWKMRNLVGRQMSNVLFNLAQGHSITAGDREIFDTLRKQWDEVSK